MPLVSMCDSTSQIEDLKALNLPTQYPLGISGFGADAAAEINADAQAYLDVFTPVDAGLNSRDPGSQNFQRTSQFTWGGKSEPVQNAAPFPSSGGGGGFSQNVNAVTDGINKLAASLIPMFSANKRPKQNVIIKKEQDYTTYAVIGGAVIVASVLAIAVGKSGRRRD